VDADSLDIRRRRCLFRAQHRGTKEMDWLLGLYAETRLAGAGEAELTLWEELVLVPDPQLYDWIMGAEAVEDARMRAEVDAVRAFHGMGLSPLPLA
jgi:antitoxin CptB